MRRIAVFLWLLATPAFGATVPCTPDVDNLYLIQPALNSVGLPPLLHIGTHLDYAVALGDATIKVVGNQILVTMPATLTTPADGVNETCDVRTLEVPQALVSSALYDVRVDYGSIATTQRAVRYGYPLVSIDIVPPSSATGEPWQALVRATTFTPAQTVSSNMRVDGNHIELDINVDYIKIAIQGHVREWKALPGLRPGTYTIIASVYEAGTVETLLRGYVQFTVEESSRRRSTTH